MADGTFFVREDRRFWIRQGHDWMNLSTVYTVTLILVSLLGRWCIFYT